MIYPLIVTAVSLIFALQVWSDYRTRRKPYQALWAAALSMSAAASLGYLAASIWGSAFAFRIYYLFGALLVAPYMGMGSVYLVMARGSARKLLIGVHVLSVIGTVLLFAAPIDVDAVAALEGSSGRGVIEAGAWLIVMIILNLFGSAAVVGVAAHSAWKSVTRRTGRSHLAGNLLIAAGFLLVALAGSAARWWPDWDGAFWTTMAVGWIVAFAGFRVIAKAMDAGSKKVSGPASSGVAP